MLRKITVSDLRRTLELAYGYEASSEKAKEMISKIQEFYSTSRNTHALDSGDRSLKRNELFQLIKILIVKEANTLNCLNIINEKLSTLIKCATELNQLGVLTEKVFKKLYKLHSISAMNEKMSNYYLFSMVEVYKILINANLMTGQNKFLINHSSICVSKILSVLKETNMLNQENITLTFKEINGDSDLPELCKALVTLNDEQILNQENLNLLMNARYPGGNQFFDCYAWGLVALHRGNILTLDNKKTICRSQSNIVAFILNDLNRAGLLNNKNRSLVENTLDQSYFMFDKVHYLVEVLLRANLLNQDNFELGMAHINLFTGEMQRDLPYHRLTQEVFNTIIDLPNQVAVNNYIRNLIHHEPVAQVQAVNTSQSTHTASVHKSVSESAIKLKQLYSKQIKKKQLRAEVFDWINQLPMCNENDVIKRAFTRIMESYEFVDRTSGVSIRELILFAWVAIHDDERRMGDLADAKKRLTEAFYEIQREYNLNEAGRDNGKKRDKPACAGGSFNKIMEKLVGLHPDVSIVFVTKETASLKLNQLVKEVVKNYLEESKRNLSEENFSNLLQDIEVNGIEVIWHKVKDQITNSMFDEFNIIYKSRTNEDFVKLIDCAKYVELDAILNAYKNPSVFFAGDQIGENKSEAQPTKRNKGKEKCYDQEPVMIGSSKYPPALVPDDDFSSDNVVAENQAEDNTCQQRASTSIKINLHTLFISTQSNGDLCSSTSLDYEEKYHNNHQRSTTNNGSFKLK